MALLNYTTKIDGWQTVGEIQQILAKAGATHVNVKMNQGEPEAVTFSIIYNGTPLNFLLPCNTGGILKYFRNLKGPEKDRLTKSGFMARVEQNAHNIGWRIIKDWIAAQCALIEIDMATLAEVFLPYLVISPDGETMARRMLDGNGLKQLTN